MRKVLLAAGIAAVGIPAYDEAALAFNNASPSNSLPFIWQGSLANKFPELWLAILGAILILLAVFLPF